MTAEIMDKVAKKYGVPIETLEELYGLGSYSKDDDRMILICLDQHFTVAQIADVLSRPESSVQNRLVKLNLN